MPDNVTFQATAATPPSGTVIATDDVSGIHYQKVKLAVGAADEAVLIDNGQQIEANSIPVVLASDVPVDVTPATPAANDYLPVRLTDGSNFYSASGGGSSGTSMVDDAAFTPGTTSITPMGAMLDNTSPDTVDEGDGGVLRMSANRNLYVQLRDAAGNERGLNVDASGNIGVTDASGSLTVDGTVAATQSGTWNVTNISGTVSLPTGASTAAKQPALGTAGTPSADVITIQGASSMTAVVIGGPVAHDGVASGNPLQQGGVAESTRPAAVADADAVRAWYDLVGRQIVQLGSGEFNYLATEYTSSQTDASLISAPGAGLSIVIYDIVVSTGTAGTVLLEEGTTTRLFGRLSLAANGGWSFNSGKGVKLGANTALTITSTTGAGPLAVTVNYAIVP